MTAKMALCIERIHAPAEYLLNQDKPRALSLGSIQLHPGRDFWRTSTRLIDRAICESDESTLQLLPYIMLIDPLNRIFCYSRGKGGAEARLHGALSIGIGGHVDAAPPACSGLQHWLKLEADRELQEEVGIMDAIPDDFHFQALLSDPTNPVGRVHMGLLTHLDVDQEELTLEAGIIEGAQWLTLTELQEKAVYDRLEGWSKATVDYLVADLGIFFATK